MIVTIIIVLLVLLFAGIREAFSGDWMPSERERPEMDNSEFDWGHNVKHNSEEL